MVDVTIPLVRRRRPLWSLFLPLAGFGLVALIVSQGSSKSPVQIDPQTGFGGYQCVAGGECLAAGPVRQVSAEWRVPTISAVSPAGSASTWLGAQDPDGGYPFIQLGTLEGTEGVAPPAYAVFWSDTAVKFRPQVLFAVNSGDLVEADMVQEKGGWVLTCRDISTGDGARRTIAYALGTTFDEAEWVQEDPSPVALVASADVPYPQISDVHFSHLVVNGHDPRIDLTDGETLMSSAGNWWVPTPVHSDGFTIAPPTGYPRQYLNDASSAAVALAAYNADLAKWAVLNLSKRTAADRALSDAYASFNARLSNQKWPPAVRGDIRAVVKQNDIIQSDLRVWALSYDDEANPEYPILLNDLNSPADTAARAALGVPPI